jgi:hypothetical protein
MTQKTTPLTLSIDPHVDTNKYTVVGFDRKGKICIALTEVSLRGIFDMMDKRSTDLVIIEDQFVGPNKKTSLDLAASRGGVVALCQVKEIKFKLINPSSWKAYMRADVKDYDISTSLVTAIANTDSPHVFACIGMFLFDKGMTIRKFGEANIGG